jgi:N-glycosylase/DNA lyase
MLKIKTNNFSLKHTIECGNFFKYFEKSDWYYICSMDKVFKVQQKGDHLHFDGVSKEFISNFFRLDEDYAKVIAVLGKDKALKKAISKYSGLRIIRQDPWECVVSYVLSQNSNIPRIRKNLNHLAELFGTKAKFDGMEFYTFPSISDFNDPKKMKVCNLGYRYEYMCRLLKDIDIKKLYSLKEESYEEAKNYLVSLHGIGPKVADCVLLFSLGFDEAFPVDVWIKRLVESFYFGGKKMPEKKLHEFGSRRFGKFAGYANQFMYHSGRLE